MVLRSQKKIKNISILNGSQHPSHCYFVGWWRVPGPGLILWCWIWTRSSRYPYPKNQPAYWVGKYTIIGYHWILFLRLVDGFFFFFFSNFLGGGNCDRLARKTPDLWDLQPNWRSDIDAQRVWCSTEGESSNMLINSMSLSSIKLRIPSIPGWCFGTILYNFMTSHSVGNFIIPTDELIFFRGVGIPWYTMVYHQPELRIPTIRICLPR